MQLADAHELDLETEPESSYIRGPKTIRIPETIYEHGELVGFQWKDIKAVELLKSIPLYNPFTSAEGYYFDTEEWSKIINFIVNECCFPEGHLTGKPFIPEKWQSAIYANLFCWKKEESNVRRYKECFIYVPRKNGKTVAFGSVITLIMFFCDPEKRGQLYAAAADVEQAALNFRHTGYMIENNPKLIGRLRERKIYRSSRHFEHNDGTIFKVLSSVADTKHGLSPNFVYIDEVHAHPNSDLIDVLLTGTGARRQPLVVYTTTADFDRPSVCNKLRDKAYAIATDKQWEPEFLPVLYEAQIDEDYTREPIWKKANPCYGKAINSDYFERLVRDARNNPVELNRFLRLHLNIRTKTETAWIPPHIWAYGNPDPEAPLLSIVAIKEWISRHPHWFNIALDQKFSTATSVDVYIGRFQAYWSWFIRQVETLKDEECHAGFDNASVKDIASFNLWFPRVGVMLHFGWCPAASIYQRSKEQNLPYSIWWEAGVINATSPMDTVDEDAILKAMVGDGEHQGLLSYFSGCREVCFDRWGSHHIYTTLKQYGYPARAYPQSFAGMNEPCRRLEALCMDKQLFHGGHPVLDWMVGNVVIVQSRDGQMRPDRSKSTNKIDGIVAGLMAMGSWLYPEVETITDIRGLK